MKMCPYITKSTGCTNTRCSNQHPENYHQEHGIERCKYDTACVNFLCPRLHGKGRKPRCLHVDKPVGCTNSSCRFLHPKGYHRTAESVQRGRPSTLSPLSSGPPSKKNGARGANKENTHPDSYGRSQTVMTRDVSERSERPPFEVTFLLDVSSSMRGEAVDRCKQALLEIAGILRPVDKLGVRTFSHRLTEVLPLTPKRALRKQELSRMVEAVEATGGTALWDAIVSTLHALRSKARGVTRKLFILTDGEDMHSTESDFASCSAAVSKPGFVVEVVLVAVTSGIGGEAQKQLERLGHGNKSYKYKAVSDVGHILEGLRFFRDIVFRETTVVQTKTVMRKEVQVKLVPKTKRVVTTTRARVK